MEINRQTFGSLVCGNLNIKTVLERAFETPSDTNQFVNCNIKKPFNLRFWKDMKM